MKRIGRTHALCALSVLTALSSAHAGDTSRDKEKPYSTGVSRQDIGRLLQLVDTQSKRLNDQERRISDAQKTIEVLRAKLEAMQRGTAPDEELAQIRAGRAPKKYSQQKQQATTELPLGAMPPADPKEQPIVVAQTGPQPASTPMPNRPVGEGQSTEYSASQVTALPEGVRVLTPVGHLTLDSSLEYDRSASNRLVFRGVEIVPGIQLGLVDANAVAQDTGIATADFRYGLFDRLEVEARIPFIYRHDRLTVLSQQINPNQPAATQVTELQGAKLGDIEFATRYQLNRGTDNDPIFVAGLRVKSTTGLGPFDVRFDGDGVAQQLATGSGSWAVEPSLAMLYPSDPVVLFANVGYLYSFSENVNKTIGTTFVGNVQPGGAIESSLGFGFSLNPQFSISLGYSNTFIAGTRTELGNTVQHSNSLESGALTLGWSFAFSPKWTLSNNFEFGVTPDAPNLRVMVRVPYQF